MLFIFLQSNSTNNSAIIFVTDNFPFIVVLFHPIQCVIVQIVYQTINSYVTMLTFFVTLALILLTGCLSSPDSGLPSSFILDLTQRVVYSGNWNGGASGTPFALYGSMPNHSSDIHGLLYKGANTLPQIYFSWSTDGLNYQGEVSLNGVGTGDSSVAAAFYNKSLFVAWIPDGPARSVNFAIFNPLSCVTTCDPMLIRTSFGPVAEYTPTLVPTSNNLALVWQQASVLYYSYYDQGQQIFPVGKMLTGSAVKATGIVGAVSTDTLTLLAYRRGDTTGDLAYTYSLADLSHSVPSQVGAASNWVWTKYSQVSLVHWGFSTNPFGADFAIYAGDEPSGNKLSYVYYSETSNSWTYSSPDDILDSTSHPITLTTAPSAVVGHDSKLYIYWAGFSYMMVGVQSAQV